MSDNQPGLRVRTRRAVQKEIAEAAISIFVERGFEATTIDEIAVAVGMSQRSVFRYFASKEEIVLGKFDVVADEMLSALRDRPFGEPIWTSLRRVFDVLVSLVQAPGDGESAEPMQRVVFESPALLAGYLQKLQQMQDGVVSELLSRAERSRRAYEKADPTPRAVTAAAFGCLVAAQYSWIAADAAGSFAGAVDRAMATVGPRS